MKRMRRLVSFVLNPRASLDGLRIPQGGSQPGKRSLLTPGDLIANLPLGLGVLIVLSLFLLVLFGPVWAPKNPYVSAQHLVPHYDVRRGEYISPPLAPSAEYPLGTDRWGNDILSLLMHGARNTLVGCAFITMARVLLGLVLGGVAGWNEGKLSDQLVMGAAGVITSVPMLISSILLIYALDIRRGLPVFIIALSAIGWTEIAQYIRSEFLVIREMPYIEGAQAVGMSGLNVAVRHVLPNVLPQLLVISFLEMGAVMMLLGELGFVGVYIGGGSRISIETDPFTYELQTLIEVPEWGAMLADGYRWLRSRPFVVVPPAVAFFVGVVGFNALGEGLRRLIQRNGLNTGFLLHKRMLLVVLGLAVGTGFVINNTGPAPWFAKLAGTFDGQRAYEHVELLSEMEGRGAGQAGANQAGAYVAEKLQAYGLEPGWKGGSYVYPLGTQIVRPAAQPSLAVMGSDGGYVAKFRHQIDFGYVTQGHGGSGDVQAPLAFVGFRRPAGDYEWGSFKGLDLRGRIAVLLRGNAPADFATEALIRGAKGVLWIVGDGAGDVRSQVQLADGDGLRMPQIPIFVIRPWVASTMLAEAGYEMGDVLGQGVGGTEEEPGWFVREVDVTVHMSLALAEPQSITAPCVLGYKPGSDYDLAGELVILFASYDGLGIDPDGTVFPAAVHDASAVGVLLELARVWQEQNLDARRSVMFVAWGAGQLGQTGAREFLSSDPNFRHLPATALNKPALLIQLHGVGAGGDALCIHPYSNARLSALVTEAAEQLGVTVVASESLAHDDVATARIPWLYLGCPEGDVGPDEDTLALVRADKLQEAGEVLALSLTQIVRQASY